MSDPKNLLSLITDEMIDGMNLKIQENQQRQSYRAKMMPDDDSPQSDRFRVKYYGDDPRGTDKVWNFRTEGIFHFENQQVRFSDGIPATELVILLDSIRWMGMLDVRVLNNVKVGAKTCSGLEIHFVNNYGNWRVAAFVAPDTRIMLSKLNTLTGLKGLVADSSTPRPDFGPFSARRMEQNIYGEWRERYPCYLYITATGHLLSNFRVEFGLPLDQLRQIDVIERGGVILDRIGLGDDLLRLEYDDDGKHRVVGFKMRQADELAQALAEQSGVPYVATGGRKKKG